MASDPDAPTTEHSVDVDVPRDAAWRFWTRVQNWAFDAAIERVHLDGPFRAGARGETVLRHGAGVIGWTVVEVDDGRAVLEIPTGGLTGRFTWRFIDLPGGRTRLTQRIDVLGPRAEAVAALAELARTAPEGMARLAEAMTSG